MEWYCKDRKNKYGDYNKSIKKYYNEDSNKWVTKLNKKTIEEKYIRYEFSCFDDREIEKHFGWSNIDRVGKYIFLIYKKTIAINKIYGKKYVYLEKINDEQKLLGYNNYQWILKKLIELEIIKIKIGRKIYNKSIRLYKLNDDFLHCEKRNVFIRNSKIIKLLDNRYKSFSNDKFIDWEIQSCKKLNIEDSRIGLSRLISIRLRKKLINNRKKLDWDFIGKREKEKIKKLFDEDEKIEYMLQCERNFELLKSDILSLKEGGITSDMFSYDDFGGRLYNIVNNKEKEFRKLLKLSVYKIEEVDMINGYISLLCRVFKGISQLSRGESDFDDKIKDIVEEYNGDDFLRMYEDVCFGNGKRIDFYKYVGMRLYGIKTVNEDLREYLKGLVLYILNGNDEFNNNKRFVDEKYTIEELGVRVFGENGWKCINKIKKTNINFRFGKQFFGFSNYKNLSKILSYMEVYIMKEKWELLIKNRINYLSLFDGVLVSSKEKDMVLDIMNNNRGINNCIRFK
tara:strand:- start:34401 stop:35933 length:1533 start_codon:yes stop_codon:yes gene_type:complete